MQRRGIFPETGCVRPRHKGLSRPPRSLPARSLPSCRRGSSRSGSALATMLGVGGGSPEWSPEDARGHWDLVRLRWTQSRPRLGIWVPFVNGGKGPPCISENGPPTHTWISGLRALNCKLGSLGSSSGPYPVLFGASSASPGRSIGGSQKHPCYRLRRDHQGLTPWSNPESLGGAQESAFGKSPGDSDGKSCVGITVLNLLRAGSCEISPQKSLWGWNCLIPLGSL